MANSRLERIGTIFTRVAGLLRAGAVKPEAKPVWFDVYQHFPPKYAPKFARPVSEEPIKSIFYPEDVIRAKIHSKKAAFVGTVNLRDTVYRTNTQECINHYENLKLECENEDEALDKAEEKVIEERTLRKVQKADSIVGSIADDFRRSKGINVADIFDKDKL